MTRNYVFGRHRLHAETHLLTRDGQPVLLGMSARRLLAVLVANAGEAVSKDRLINSVWGHAPVSDNTLHVHMTSLRKVVGDGCITTKQGFGYRFTAAVRIENPSAHRTVARETSGCASEAAEPARLASQPARKLIGRDSVLAELQLLTAHAPIVTLVGPGGVGKTCLMLALGEVLRPRFGGSVWLVDLATLKDPALVPHETATALGIKIPEHLPALEGLSRALDGKTGLVLLDNCEHLLAASAALAGALVAASAGLRVVATSRIALKCGRERVCPVLPLSLPSPGAAAEHVRTKAAVEMFTVVAREVDPAFDLDGDQIILAGSICRRLDGLPLAIQMAARWAPVLGMDELDARLVQSLASWAGLRGSALERHDTLHATFAWGYELLTSREQKLLRHLAIFPSGFSLKAAEAVLCHDALPASSIQAGLLQLVRQSLVTVARSSGTAQYRLLGTTRVFAAEKIADSAERNALCARHARYVHDVLEQAHAEWETTSDSVWLGRYSAILPDLRAALEWSMLHPLHIDDGVALAAASWPLWGEMSLSQEGQRLLSRAAARTGVALPPLVEARLSHGLGELRGNTPQKKRARGEFERAITLWRQLEDRLNLGRALTGLGHKLLFLGDVHAAQAVLEEASETLAQGNWPRSQARALCTLMRIYSRTGRFEEARLIGAGAERLCHVARAERLGLFVRANLLEITIETGALEEAIDTGRELSLTLRKTPHAELLGMVLGNLAGAYTAQGDLAAALVMAREAAPLLRDHGTLFWLFDHLALCAALGGRLTDAALLRGYADAICLRFEYSRHPIENAAYVRLIGLLDEALSDAEQQRLSRFGSALSEAQALDLALPVCSRVGDSAIVAREELGGPCRSPQTPRRHEDEALTRTLS
jgi:predicted ATPase/DNA-binding winged helix-turn-helix (wHTH) protein